MARRSKSVRVFCPPGTTGERLARESSHRPVNVPSSAVFLVSYIDLPSENEQRTGSWVLHQGWKKRLLKDFADCMNAQPHPGVLEHPRVHIQMHVMGVGDDINRRSRAKYVIDLLQAHRLNKNGGRQKGLLGLIQDDSLLDDNTLTITEVRAARQNTGEVTPRSQKPIVEAHTKVLVWAWEDEDVVAF